MATGQTELVNRVGVRTPLQAMISLVDLILAREYTRLSAFSELCVYSVSNVSSVPILCKRFI